LFPERSAGLRPKRGIMTNNRPMLNLFLKKEKPNKRKSKQEKPKK